MFRGHHALFAYPGEVYGHILSECKGRLGRLLAAYQGRPGSRAICGGDIWRQSRGHVIQVPSANDVLGRQQTECSQGLGRKHQLGRGRLHI